MSTTEPPRGASRPEHSKAIASRRATPKRPASHADKLKSGPGTREDAKSERSRTATLYGLLAGGQHTVYDFLRFSVAAAEASGCFSACLGGCWTFFVGLHVLGRGVGTSSADQLFPPVSLSAAPCPLDRLVLSAITGLRWGGSLRTICVVGTDPD